MQAPLKYALCLLALIQGVACGHSAPVGAPADEPNDTAQPPSVAGCEGCVEEGVALLLAGNAEGAASLLERACESGDAQGCHNLAMMYYLGQGVTQDHERAAHFYGRSCEGGMAQDCFNAGQAYRRDPARALNYYERACESRVWQGCDSAASAYFVGQDVTRDYRRAAELYAQACEYGSAGACGVLGQMYLSGQGVSRDPARAIQLYERACERGNPTACVDLARLAVEQNEDTTASLFADLLTTCAAAVEYLADHPPGSSCSRTSFEELVAERVSHPDFRATWTRLTAVSHERAYGMLTDFVAREHGRSMRCPPLESLYERCRAEPGAEAANGAPSTSSSFEIEAVDENRFLITRDTLAHLLSEGVMLSAGRYIPLVHRGQPGVRVYGIRAASVLSQLGLRNGDFVLTLNEVELTEALITSGLASMVTDLRDAAHIRLTLERRGESMELQYDVMESLPSGA